MADRVLLIGPEPPPTGGIAAHLIALRRALGERGVAATVVDPRSRLRLVTELGRAAVAGDVVHLHVCGHNRSSYGLLGACLAASRAVVVTLHSGLLPGYLDRLTSTARRTIAGLLERCAAVVCVSAPVAAAVRELGVGEAVVATPFLRAGLRVGRPPIDVAAAHEAGELLVAAPVAPGPEYGLSVLAGGFAYVAAVRHDVMLAAFGPGGADREVARSLAARGLDDRVLALGELSGGAAAATMALAEVVVRPTLADGDAISVREARALGRKVVASTAAPRPPGTHLCPPGDPGAFGAALLAALREPAPPAFLDDGLAPLLSIYAGLEVSACAESPAA